MRGQSVNMDGRVALEIQQAKPIQAMISSIVNQSCEGTKVRTLVSGGSGFIGSHLCKRLIDDGHEVICVDNLVTGHKRNIQALEGIPAFRFVMHDVIQPLPELGQIDAIFHLASPASPPGYFRIPLETALVNSQGSHNLLEVARKNGARYLVASTSETYGDPLVHPQPETYWGNVNPNGMRSCYDESKRFSEALAFIYWRQFDVDARIIRIFNCYGPHSDPIDGRIVPNFISQALRGEPITIYGTGSQTRSLCYISDLVEGIIRAAFRPGTTGNVFNIGNPDERSILEFAELINALCGSRSNIVFQPPISTDDPQRRCPDITKAKAVLDWEPMVDLHQGMMNTITWFRERLAAPTR